MSWPDISSTVDFIHFMYIHVLKVGAFSFGCITILLIYSINCWKALLTMK